MYKSWPNTLRSEQFSRRHERLQLPQDHAQRVSGGKPRLALKVGRRYLWVRATVVVPHKASFDHSTAVEQERVPRHFRRLAPTYLQYHGIQEPLVRLFLRFQAPRIHPANNMSSADKGHGQVANMRTSTRVVGRNGTP